jgi:cytochrome c
VAKAVNKTGPHLVGLVGRRVASIEGYKYSEAMRAHAATVPVWDEAALSAYIENPKAVVAKSRMVFPGLKKADERTDLIAYLKTKTQ